MKKTTILIIFVTILIGIGVFINLDNFLFTGKIIEDRDFHSLKIAICNKTNYCEDYVIECAKKTTIRTTATGFAIQHNEEWEDPREQKNNLCE